MVVKKVFKIPYYWNKDGTVSYGCGNFAHTIVIALDNNANIHYQWQPKGVIYQQVG